MSSIGAEQLQVVLTALGEQLAQVGERAHLVVIGGSALIALDVVARATRDVDIVALDVDGSLISADPLPEALARAAALVARDFKLEPNWLNAGPTSLLDLGLPAGFDTRTVTRDYGIALRVSFAARIDQVSLKLYAAADRRAPRDFADLRDLEPTESELHAAARWARTHNMPGQFDDALARTLEALGIEDAGRDA
jgi:hypothetical protein